MHGTLFILAGNHKEFMYYKKMYGRLNVRCIEIDTPQKLEGMPPGYKYLVIGSFVERDDANEIATVIKTTGGEHMRMCGKI